MCFLKTKNTFDRPANVNHIILRYGVKVNAISALLISQLINAPSIMMASVDGRINVLALPLPVLQYDVRQHDVHAYNFVRSPITMQPDSQFDAHFRSNDHIRGLDVAFSVLVVYENFCTMHVNSSSLHFFMKLE